MVNPSLAPASPPFSEPKAGWDLTGPYDVVRDWPKSMFQLPGHENWGWGARFNPLTPS